MPRSSVLLPLFRYAYESAYHSSCCNTLSWRSLALRAVGISKTVWLPPLTYLSTNRSEWRGAVFVTIIVSSAGVGWWASRKCYPPSGKRPSVTSVVWHPNAARVNRGSRPEGKQTAGLAITLLILDFQRGVFGPD